MRVTVTGTQSVNQALLDLQAEFGSTKARSSLVPALRRAVEPALNTIRPAVPVDTGKLRVHTKRGAKVSSQKDRKRKYHSKNSLAYGFVVVGIEYRDEKGQYRPAAEAIEFGTADQPARPFIRANFQRAIPAMTETLAQQLNEQIDKWAAKQRTKG